MEDNMQTCNNCEELKKKIEDLENELFLVGSRLEDATGWLTECWLYAPAIRKEYTYLKDFLEEDGIVDKNGEYITNRKRNAFSYIKRSHINSFYRQKVANIALNENKIEIQFYRNETLAQEVSEIPSSVWDPEKLRWIITDFSIETLNKILEFANKTDFGVTKNLLGLLIDKLGKEKVIGILFDRSSWENYR